MDWVDEAIDLFQSLFNPDAYNKRLEADKAAADAARANADASRAAEQQKTEQTKTYALYGVIGISIVAAATLVGVLVSKGSKK